MAKISIITVLNTINYGSVLQTLATQTFMEQLGLEAEFVDFARKDQTVGAIIWNKLKTGRSSLTSWLKKPINDCLDIAGVLKSQSVFRQFIKQNIHISNTKYCGYDDLTMNPPSADIYCTGSDQMWNTFWNQGIEKSFFLEYAPIGKKRISFSTSIGNTAFSELEEEQAVPLIQKFDFVTVREKSAETLLRHYGVDAVAIPDPTLLFDRDFWMRLASDEIRRPPYLLVYQLHPTHKDADFDAAVKQIAREKGLEIVRVVYSRANRKFGKKEYLPSVERFLSLLRNADYIVTDSFHGTAFSINFEKQFAVLYPTQFSTRMQSLLELTGLTDRRYEDTSSLERYLEPINYEKPREILNAERQRTREMFRSMVDSI